MIKRQSNKFSMLEAVHAYLTKHESVFVNIPGMTQAKENLGSKFAEISGKENQRLNVLKGKTLAKEATRENIITHGLAFAAKLFDYGKKSKNIELNAQSDFNRSELSSIRDAELLNILDTVKENAEANIEALSSYGITAEKLQSFDTMISVYKASIDSKLTSEAIKTSARKTLTVLFREADVILQSLDKMMEEFHDSDSQFYMGYKSARSIKDLGLRHKPETLNPELNAGGVEGEKEEEKEKGTDQ